MGRGRARLRHAHPSGPQQRLADRAAGNDGVEDAADAADEGQVRGGNGPLLRERAQVVTLLPATALAEYLDDVAKSLRPFQPIGLQAGFDTVGIPGMDGADHFIMLRYGKV
jgi:hypothetical protein